MKMIVNMYSHAFQEELGVELIPMGIESVEAGTPDEAVSLLTQDQGISIILTENHNIDFLKKMKEVKPSLHIFLMAHQTLKPETLRTLTSIGITSIIIYSENVALIAEEVVKDIIQNNIKANERRFHVRVQPRDVENVKGAIFIKDLKKFIHGVILDISAGGLALKLDDSLDASLLSVKTVYDPVVISMKGMQIKTLSRIVGLRNDVAGFKFENVEAKDMKKIAVYIHKKVTEDTRKLIAKVV